MSYTQRILVIIVAVLLGIAVLGGAAAWATSPERASKSFEAALQKQDKEKILSMVRSDIDASSKEDIEFFVDDWVQTGTPEVKREKVESWRVRPENGDKKEENVPTTKYWAHFSNVSMTVSFEEFEDPVVVTFERKSKNAWSPFAQLFRGWNLAGISYQTADDEEVVEDDDAELETNTNSATDVNNNTNSSNTNAEEVDEILIDDETGDADGEAEAVEEGDDSADEEVFDAGLIEQ